MSSKHTLPTPLVDRGLLIHDRVGTPQSIPGEKTTIPSAFIRIVRWFMEAPDAAPPFAAAILDRFPVGMIFLIEGILKFHLPAEFGVGRFVRIGIPFPHFFAPFDGVFEIVCGILLLLGLLTRFAVIPMIINMLVAIYTTKLPVLAKEGFWKMAHAALLDYAMLFGLISILIAGAGTWSLDELLEYRWKDLFRSPHVA